MSKYAEASRFERKRGFSGVASKSSKHAKVGWCRGLGGGAGGVVAEKQSNIGALCLKTRSILELRDLSIREAYQKTRKCGLPNG